MQQNADQNYLEYRHILRSDGSLERLTFSKITQVISFCFYSETLS